MKKLIIPIFIFAFAVFLSGCATKPLSKEEKVQNSKYYYKIGLSYLNSGNIAQAIYYLNKAYEIDPKDPDILNALGIAYTNVKEYSRAKEFFLKSIEILPDKAETYTNLGVLLAQEGNYEQAIWYFEKALENPEYRNKEKALYNMAIVYRKMGNLPKFEESLKKTISYNPYFINAYITLGNYYILQKRYLDAYNIFTKAINAGLVNPYIYFGLGKAYYYLGEYEKSRYFLQKAKKIIGDDLFLKQEVVRYISMVDKKIVEQKEKDIQSNEFKESVIIPEDSKKVEIEKEIKEKKPVVIPKETKKAERAVSEEKKEYKTTTEKVESKVDEVKIARKTTPETPKKVVKPKIRFYIQVGVFSEKQSAMKLSDRLKKLGFEPEIRERNIDGTKYYFVIIGYFKSYLEASRFFRKNLKPEGFKGIVKFVRK
ncbi:SPOR domain-containing protein [Persephonella sp.]